MIYGVEIEAHATSQIVNAVLNGRPLLHIWSEGWEYVWILAWGLGIALGLILQSPENALEHWCSQCWAGGNLLRAADLELVGSSRTGVTGFCGAGLTLILTGNRERYWSSVV